MKNLTENPWKLIDKKEKYANPWIQLVEHQIINPAGNPGIYGVVHFKNIAIGIIVLDEEKQTYIVGQYRFPLEQYSWEIPEGGCPEGEAPLQAAQRELEEEAGIKARKWTKLMEMHLSNSVSDELSIIYLAEDLEFGEAQPEETEILQLRKIPFETLFQMVQRGEITDSITVAAVLQLKLKLENII